MADHRFILDGQYQVNSTVELTKDEFHHLHILRLHAKDIVYIVDSIGTEYKGEITSVTKHQAQVRLIAETGRQTESDLFITLYQGLTTDSKLELVIQKTTELGIGRIVPVISDFSQIKNRPERDQKLRRRQEIARQAARQSGRLKVPEITAAKSFENCLEDCLLPKQTILFHNISGYQTGLWNQIAGTYCPLRGSVNNTPLQHINLFVGPEGGFAEQEVRMAKEKGFNITSIGPRILRAETAGIVAVALAQMTWGDLGTLGVCRT